MKKDQIQNRRREWKGMLLLVLGIVGIALGVILMTRPRTVSNSAQRKTEARESSNRSPQSSAARVPAYFETTPVIDSLPPTLPPDQFFGQARRAYQVAREIPQTLAQLPCYCYCDEGHGHKSLHSCYESNHSSMCAVCVNEALLAYRLEKEQGLTPRQIRERIIAEFAPKQ